MISWFSITYGALLSGVLAAVFLSVVLRERRPSLLVAAAVSAAAGPLAWNAILRDAGGHGFFVDAPVVVLPVSWQDTGSGVFTVAVAALALGFGPLGDVSARRLATVALLCGLGAFLVDVYLY